MLPLVIPKGESLLPNELLMRITEELEAISPPGWHRKRAYVSKFMDPNEGLEPQLGWIVMSQVSKRWRAVALGLNHLWARAILAFPSKDFIMFALNRSRNHPLDLDIDLLYRSSHRLDRTYIFKWFLASYDLFLPHARTIKSTLARDDCIVTAKDYATDKLFGSDGSWWSEICIEQCPNLVELIFPVTVSCLYKLPNLSSLTVLCLTKATPRSYWDKNFPRNEGYSTQLKSISESSCHTADLLALLRSNIRLRRLVLDEVLPNEYTRDDGEHTNMEPVHCQFLDVHIISSKLVEIARLMQHIITPDPWDIMSCLDSFTTLPSFITPQINQHRDLTITRSRSMLYLTFAPHESPLNHHDAPSFNPSPTITHERYSRYRLHACSPCLTLSSGTYMRTLEPGSLLSLGSLLVSATLPFQQLIQHESTEYSKILATIQSVQDVFFEDESRVHIVVKGLPCPSRLSLTCREDWKATSGVEKLLRSLDKWRDQGTVPQSIVVKGFKRDSDTALLNARPDLNIQDLRITLKK